jgi:hypothetical protein
MFLDNKYTKAYFSIIKNCKTRETSESYFEKHHIIPKSLGGDNSKENLVNLTYREHFICHKLLVKMTEGSNKRKMACALWTMTRNTGNRIISSYQYSSARSIYIKHHPNKNLSEKARQDRGAKVSASLKGRVFPHQHKNLLDFQKKMKEGSVENPRTKSWLVTTPNGDTLIVRNLAAFCREHDLSKGSLCGSGKTKGYTAKHID